MSNERLISASGLSIVGLLLGKTDLADRLNRSRLKENASPHIRHSDVAFACIGLSEEKFFAASRIWRMSVE